MQSTTRTSSSSESSEDEDGSLDQSGVPRALEESQRSPKRPRIGSGEGQPVQGVADRRQQFALASGEYPPRYRPIPPHESAHNVSQSTIDQSLGSAYARAGGSLASGAEDMAGRLHKFTPHDPTLPRMSEPSFILGPRPGESYASAMQPYQQARLSSGCDRGKKDEIAALPGGEDQGEEDNRKVPAVDLAAAARQCSAREEPDSSSNDSEGSSLIPRWRQATAADMMQRSAGGIGGGASSAAPGPLAPGLRAISGNSAIGGHSQGQQLQASSAASVEDSELRRLYIAECQRLGITPDPSFPSAQPVQPAGQAYYPPGPPRAERLFYDPPFSRAQNQQFGSLGHPRPPYPSYLLQSSSLLVGSPSYYPLSTQLSGLLSRQLNSIVTAGAIPPELLGAGQLRQTIGGNEGQEGRAASSRPRDSENSRTARDEMASALASLSSRPITLPSQSQPYATTIGLSSAVAAQASSNPLAAYAERSRRLADERLLRDQHDTASVAASSSTMALNPQLALTGEYGMGRGTLPYAPAMMDRPGRNSSVDSGAARIRDGQQRIETHLGAAIGSQEVGHLRENSPSLLPPIDERGLADFTQRRIFPLSGDEDENWLSEYLCYVRSDMIEVFRAGPQGGNKNSKRLLTRQVGFRCRFCAHLPQNQRKIRSSTFPNSTDRIYQSVYMMIHEHFPECQAMPEPTRQKFKKLKRGGNQGAANSVAYWDRSARNLGMVNTQAGIMMASDLGSVLREVSGVPQGQAGLREHPVEYGSSSASGRLPGPVSSCNMPTQADGQSSYRSLVVPDDLQHGSEFLYTLLQHAQPIVLTQAELVGRRKSLPLGSPGFGCRYCMDNSRTGGNCRFFPIHRRRLPDKVKDLYEHLRRCTLCPEQARLRLDELHSNQGDADREANRNRIFFDRVWARIKGGTIRGHGCRN